MHIDSNIRSIRVELRTHCATGHVGEAPVKNRDDDSNLGNNVSKLAHDKKPDEPLWRMIKWRNICGLSIDEIRVRFVRKKYGKNGCGE